jgi:hypothetical protein
MKLVIVRTGGFGGLKRRAERDERELSPEQRAALDQVVKEYGAPGAEAPAKDPGADPFSYRLEVQDENGTKSITLPESKMPRELKGIVTQ